MRAYVEADVPEACYLFEMLLWVALGRVPQALYDLEGREIRSVPFYQDSGYQPEDLQYFFEKEFDAIGASIDYSRYFKAVGIWEYKASFEVTYDQDKMEHRFQNFPDAISADQIESVKYFDECNSLFDPLIERAKIKIFDALMEGNLVGWGYIGERDVGPDFDEQEMVYCNKGSISSEKWIIDACDLFNDSLIDGNNEYSMIQFRTEDVFKVFQKPLIPSHPATSQSHGTSILVYEAGPHASTPKQRRGRPAKQEGIVRKVVQNIFSERIRKGDAPKKAEALYQEIIEYVELAFGEKISRTTAQGYIRHIQNRTPEILPENKP